MLSLSLSASLSLSLLDKLVPPIDLFIFSIVLLVLSVPLAPLLYH